MENMYTNWHAGLRKDGKTKTYDYSFDRKSTVAYANVEKLIDDNLSKGIFSGLNHLYIQIIDGTCRHTGHSGPNGHPSKRDRCAVAEKVLDRKKMKERKIQAALQCTDIPA